MDSLFWVNKHECADNSDAVFPKDAPQYDVNAIFYGDDDRAVRFGLAALMTAEQLAEIYAGLDEGNHDG